jgi:hypothetical protein
MATLGLPLQATPTSMAAINITISGERCFLAIPFLIFTLHTNS